MVPDEGAAELLVADAPPPAPRAEAASVALLAHHLAGRAAIPLVEQPAPAIEAERRRALAARGIAVAAPRALDAP
jgi:hypothetical protein